MRVLTPNKTMQYGLIRGTLQQVCAVLMVLLLLASSSAFASPAMQWVQKMSDAMRELSYQGTFVYQHRNLLESMEIVHVRDERGETERLLSLNGEARQVIRNNNDLTSIWPSSGRVVVDTSRKNNFSPIFIPEDITRLAKFYDIQIIGKDRIANEDTVVVHISPKDQFRYGLKFWINEANSLMMKSSLLDSSGSEIEQVMFTSLELIPEQEKKSLTIMPKLDEGYSVVRFQSGEGSQAFAAEQTWQVEGLPGGFWRDSVYKRQLPNSSYSVHQMVFTDGLASLSVFIEKQANSLQEGATSMGAVNAYIRVLEDHSVTAIGEVPALTVQRFAESVTYNK